MRRFRVVIQTSEPELERILRNLGGQTLNDALRHIRCPA
jgi:hypothetical protein